jgi:ribosome-associated toxin RatA of RatAB toxin-antitoxin module
MSPITVTRVIQASPELVFQTISDITNYSQAIPHIKNVEFLSETRSGVGTRFRETRIMNGKQLTTELEVTEYAENDRIRLISDAGGTVWDSLFTVTARGSGGTRLEMKMDARSYKFLAKLLTPLIQPIVQRGVENDMDMVKAFCERSDSGDQALFS